jgi:hypothetical protein
MHEEPTMPKRVELDEEASRANDQKEPPARRRGNQGGNAGDGKDADIPQGGKRRGPGRWIDPAASGD